MKVLDLLMSSLVADLLNRIGLNLLLRSILDERTLKGRTACVYVFVYRELEANRIVIQY